MLNSKSLASIYVNKIMRKLLRCPYDYRPFYGVYYYSGKKSTKRALLSYRVLQVREQAKHTWSAAADVHDMLRALSELGYVTDVVYSRDTMFVPQKKYDLFIGHEGYNFTRLCDLLPKETPKIHFAATAYWRFQNVEEDKRIEEVFQKTGVRMHAERLLHADEDIALDRADGIILSSNERGKATYPTHLHEKIVLLPTASFTNKKMIDPEKKDFSRAKQHFLFLSGSGNAHKQLDVALEAFAMMPDKQLFICTFLEKEFKEAYNKELFHTKNIFYLGYIKLYSKEFYDLMSRCVGLVFPSCSEGSPGSVIDCMMQGLVPIVSRASHVDVDGLGYDIEPCTKEKIMELVTMVSQKDDAFLKERSAHIQATARTLYSPNAFREGFKAAIREFIHKKNANASLS